MEANPFEIFNKMVEIRELTQYQFRNILNTPQQIIPKVVIKHEGLIYRIGDYNSYLTQVVFIKYCEDQNIPYVMPITEVDYKHDVILTSQEKVEVFDMSVTDKEVIEKFVKVYGDKFLEFIKTFNIVGLAHSNSGILNGKPVILDWIGGPILVGNRLINWDGTFVCNFNPEKKEK